MTQRDLKDLTVIVVGIGSIGTRHLTNLQELGVRDIGVVEIDPGKLASVTESTTGVTTYADLAAALAQMDPDCALVCTPPHTHLELARDIVRAGIDVFIEKPLSDSLEGTQEFLEDVQESGCVARVGYNLRYHPGLRLLKETVEAGELGSIHWLRAEFGQYLPDWRPGRDYRTTYTASRGMGGGILLDASHELDYVMWLLGQPTEVTSMVGQVSSLDIDVEDCATVLLRFPQGALADVHVDFVQRAYSRSCKVVGSEGVALWDYHWDQLKIYRAQEDEWEGLGYEFDPAVMYKEEIADFLGAAVHAEGRSESVKQARNVLAVTLQARDGLKKDSVPPR